MRTLVARAIWSVIALATMAAALGCTEERSIRSAEIGSEIDGLLPHVSDMAEASWRLAEFASTDFESVGSRTNSCAADLPNLARLGGPLSATRSANPDDWGARFLFNGARGADGSQLWSEVWAFEDNEAAIASFENTRRTLTGDRGPTCLIVDTEREQTVASTLNFERPESIAYAIDSRIGDVETHVEVHIIQRDRFVGMLIFYDHAPATLWRTDGERLLELFEERLSNAP